MLGVLAEAMGGSGSFVRLGGAPGRAVLRLLWYSMIESELRRLDVAATHAEEWSLKFVCLVYGEEKHVGAMTDDECMAYDQALRNAGRCLASEALQPVRTAKTVRVRQGRVSVTDGPFTETKECLAGFYLIDAKDIDEAIQIASEIPPAHVGSIEIRPIRELTSTTGERRQL